MGKTAAPFFKIQSLNTPLPFFLKVKNVKGAVCLNFFLSISDYEETVSFQIVKPLRSYLPVMSCFVVFSSTVCDGG